MEIEKPTLGLGDHSPIEVASKMHTFSRDMQSYYKVVHGHLLDKLDQLADEADLSEIKSELQDINQKIEYFHMLNSAASIVSTLLHSPLMVTEFRKPS